MTRIRLAVLLLAVVLLVGIGLLVQRAFDLDGAARYARHQGLADRVFDEMDDRLNALLSVEDSRSFHQYRFLYVPEGAVSAERAWIRSELSQEPPVDYILGWFQYDADGRFRSPLRPEVDERAILPDRWRAGPTVESTEAELRRLTAPLRELPDFPRADPRLAQADLRAAGQLPRNAQADPPPRAQAEERFAVPPPPPAPVSKAAPEVRTEPTKAAAAPKTTRAAEPSAPVAALEKQVQAESSQQPAPKQTSKQKRRKAKEESRKSAASSLNKAAGRRSERVPRQATTKAANVYGLQQQSAGLVESLEPDALRETRGDQELAALQAKDRRLDAAEVAPATGEERPEQAAGGAADPSWTAGSTEEAIAALWEDDEDEREVVRRVLDEIDEEALEAEALDDELADDPEWAEWVESQRQAVIDAELRSRAEAAAAEEQAPAAAPAPAPSSERPRFDRASVPLPETEEDAVAIASSPSPRLDASRELPEGERRRARATVDEAGGLRGVAEPRLPEAADVPPPLEERVRVEAGPAEVQTPPRSPIDTDEDLTVTISQLQGMPVDDDRLVLFRKVSVGPTVFLQGVVLKLPELVRDLEREVVAGTDLAGYLSFVWGEAAGASADYTFRHVFAAPFEAVEATALFDQVPREDADPLPFLLAVTLLLVVATLAGLYLLYRMVAVVVRFAEQRNNFVSAVSHELKTPLTAIRMYAEMLRDGIVSSDDKRQEYYGTITAESERLSRLINNVLELAKLEKGARTVSLSVGNLRPVLEEALRVLEPHARSRGFEFVLEADDDLPAVRFEHDALLQVLINLVDNALKFSAGSAEKRVILQAQVDPYGGVVIRVRDRGPGVPQPQLARIFQPFYRGERELTRTTKGTGIGLALVHGLIECMGGRVTARNHPTGGFEVEIGLAPAVG